MFCKVLYWAHYCLITLWIICSISQQIMKSVILLMAVVLILVVWILITFSLTLYEIYKKVYEWFTYNSVKANPYKFQFILLGNTGSHTLQVSDINTKSVSSFTLLGITIDSKLSFNPILKGRGVKTSPQHIFCITCVVFNICTWNFHSRNKTLYLTF